MYINYVNINIYIYICISIYLYICLSTYVYIYIYMHIHMYTHAHRYMRIVAAICTCVHVYIYMYKYIYIYVHVFTSICAYIYTHTRYTCSLRARCIEEPVALVESAPTVRGFRSWGCSVSPPPSRGLEHNLKLRSQSERKMLVATTHAELFTRGGVNGWGGGAGR